MFKNEPLPDVIVDLKTITILASIKVSQHIRFKMGSQWSIWVLANQAYFTEVIFSPQIKEIPKDAYVMQTSSQRDILMYIR